MHKSQFLPQRIVIVGATGSGKTTLAQQLAAQLGYPHIELDALNWRPNWQSAPTAILREQVAQALSGEHWIVDGNYGCISDWGQLSRLLP